MHFEFGPFALDADRGVLTRDGAAVDAGHRAVLLLQALLRAEGRAVTKAELMDAAWPGLVVEESNLSVQVAALRKLLGNSPTGRPWIATIARVGYRFDAPVSAARSAPSGDHRPAQGAQSAQGGKPSIVVLPLVPMGGGPEHDYLVDGITEDIIVALTRFRWFHVIGRNSSFAFKGRTIGSQQVAQELGVRYVLEGSVRMSAPGRSQALIPEPVMGEGTPVIAQQVRITTQLIDAATAHQLWAERFELGPAELGRAQVTIAQRGA
ncbi:MAG: winged helix-turn-helix domain-containing protein, partial [Betaproteobacteria bacterium]